MTSTSFLRPLALAALVCASGASQAALTVYTTAAGFAAATSAPGVDTFANLSTTSLTLSSITRTAGAYSYTASAPGDFFGGGGANPFLSPDYAFDSVTFDSFSSSVRGFAGNFFGSDLAGAFLAGGVVTLVATDALGATATQTVAATGILSNSFVGFVSNAPLASVVLTAVQPVSGLPVVWPAVDNLTLATAAAVPEPGTWGLMLAGLAVFGWAARRQR